MRILLILSSLLLCVPSYAKSVDAYLNDYSNFSCTTLEIKKKDIRQKFGHVSKAKKNKYKRQLKAISILNRDKSC
ncbi:hypothetical protein L4C36_23045 [Photobacterium japonica]|uniref:hypothetical protein n=1 Tax=Photobacterium japonica TaxID=2910235 RepID=UPI003D0B32D9